MVHLSASDSLLVSGSWVIERLHLFRLGLMRTVDLIFMLA